tara:strand:- start:989 stop:1363 length:375 start_codon:yes stop_codon:yes gene_type:complete
MSDKKEKKLTYAMSEVSASTQLSDARQHSIKAKSLIELYSCSKFGVKYRDIAINILAEYLTNVNFYAEFMEAQLRSENRIENKKTGTEQIIVSQSDFGILNSYLLVMAACENELEALGISMRTH